VIHTVKGFSVFSETEVDIFLEFPSFFYDPMDVGNLISGFSVFSKSSLYIWDFLKNIYFCFTEYAKTFDCVDHNRFLKRWEYQTTLPTSLETCTQVKKQQLEMDMKQQTGSKLGKEFVKAVYCHLAYLTPMKKTSGEMLSWNQDCWRNINNLRYADDTTFMEESKDPFDEGKRRE